MTHPRLTSMERKTKVLKLQGKGTRAIARQLNVSPNTIYKIVGRLIHYGELIPIEGTVNPVIYDDGNPSRLNPPTGDCFVKHPPYGQGVDNPTSTPVLRPFSKEGICTDSVCPDGFVELHMNGCIKMEVIQSGELGVIRDHAGFTIGNWIDKGEIRGSHIWSGYIRADNQEMTMQFRIGVRKGTRTFMFYPSRVFLDPMVYERPEEAKEPLLERARFVSALLTAHGWTLGEPVFSGKLEAAYRDHPLTRLITKEQVPEGADIDIDIDTSKGVPEAEIKGMETMEEWEKVRMLANFPSEIIALNGKVDHCMDQMALTQRWLDTILSQLDTVTAILDRLKESACTQSEIIGTQLEATAKLAQVNANLTTALIGLNQQRIDIFTQTPEQDVVTSDSNGKTRPQHWEGYQ